MHTRVLPTNTHTRPPQRVDVLLGVVHGHPPVLGAQHEEQGGAHLGAQPHGRAVAGERVWAGRRRESGGNRRVKGRGSFRRDASQMAPPPSVQTAASPRQHCQTQAGAAPSRPPRPPTPPPTSSTYAMGDTPRKRWMSSAVGPAPARRLPSSVPQASTKVQSGMSETGRHTQWRGKTGGWIKSSLCRQAGPRVGPILLHRPVWLGPWKNPRSRSTGRHRRQGAVPPSFCNLPATSS